MLQKLSVRAIFFLLTERKAHLYKIDLSLNGERGKKKISLRRRDELVHEETCLPRKRKELQANCLCQKKV
jgi:hypothetical protein